MAKQRSKNNSAATGGGIGGAILGICIAFYEFMQENSTMVLLVLFIVCALIAFIFVAKYLANQRYWEWYFSRERGLDDISSSQYLLQEQTDMAIGKQGYHVSGCGMPGYQAFAKAFELAFSSNDKLYIENNQPIEKYVSTSYSATNLLQSINVYTDGEPMSIYVKVNQDGGYSFVMLPEIIYAFIVGANRFTFVGAYSSQLFKIEVGHIGYTKTYTHITDMSHQPRGYFLRYCDVKDSQALAAGWKYETNGGYRDGRRQSNNAFIVKFNYTKMGLSWGQLQSTIACSNTDVHDYLKETYDFYLSPETYVDLSAIDTTAVEQRELLSGEPYQVEQENFNQERIEQQAEFLGTNEDVNLSCEEVRAKNRETVKTIAEILNSTFAGNPEFKTYQVRKDHDDWKLQDAEVYCNVDKNGASVCLEFILRTDLASGITNFEYKISSDNNTVLAQHKPLFDSYEMKQSVSHYSAILYDITEMRDKKRVSFFSLKIESLVKEFIEFE